MNEELKLIDSCMDKTNFKLMKIIIGKVCYIVRGGMVQSNNLNCQVSEGNHG